jgi:hypothetical protein
MAVMPDMQACEVVGTPITDVLLMGGLANRRRSLLLNGQPTVQGYVLVGDASLYTNATFGQALPSGSGRHRPSLSGPK